jgi:nucleotide-binding universal stress UspA family protein
VINPLRSEADAFRFTMIIVALASPVILAGILFSTPATLVVAAGVVVGVLIGLFVLKRDEPEEKMLLGRPRADGRHRILVLANETLGGEALRREITHRMAGEDTEVYVVCPALNVSKIKHWVSDEDEARRQAQERLDDVIARLGRQGIHVRGDIGDADPVQAMEDALRLFPADEAILSTHPPGRSNWLERDVVQRSRDRFALPVSHVVVDLEREREFVSREETG